MARSKRGIDGQTMCKRDLWMRHFLDAGGPGFMNKTESAILAGYDCDPHTEEGRNAASATGHGNFVARRKEIAEWLEECGLSKAFIFEKLLQLMHAEKVVFFSHQGVVTEQRVMADSQAQLKALDMALKVKGLYAPEKKDLTVHAGDLRGLIAAALEEEKNDVRDVVG